MPLYQTAVEALIDKRWRAQDCNNNNLVADKLNTLSKKNEKAKRDSIKII